MTCFGRNFTEIALWFGLNCANLAKPAHLIQTCPAFQMPKSHNSGTGATDLLVPRWAGGQDGALDVTVVSALQQAMLAGSAATDSYAVTKAFERKVAKAGEACRAEGISFIPVAADTLGGLHSVAVEQVKKLGSSLARHQGQEEQEVVRHLFQRLSLVLMRGNAQLLVNRMPPDDVPDGEVDGTL